MVRNPEVTVKHQPGSAATAIYEPIWDEEACLLLLLIFYSGWHPRRHVETHQLFLKEHRNWIED